jgi:hypothetical protein
MDENQHNANDVLSDSQVDDLASDSGSPAYTSNAPDGPTQVQPSDDDSHSTSVTPKADDSATATNGSSNDLLDIKQQALQHLSPLVSQLDQTPEEKFKTTMMMIQASDDQSLVKEAYEAAKEISDEKQRAQALLDIINEINYFTQNHQS